MFYTPDSSASPSSAPAGAAPEVAVDATVDAAQPPAVVMATLRSLDYPADREDLLRAARTDGLDNDALGLIEALDGDSYNGVFDVVVAIERATGAELVGD